jgi:hypothetical protein
VVNYNDTNPSGLIYWSVWNRDGSFYAHVFNTRIQDGTWQPGRQLAGPCDSSAEAREAALTEAGRLGVRECPGLFPGLSPLAMKK